MTWHKIVKLRLNGTRGAKLDSNWIFYLCCLLIYICVCVCVWEREREREREIFEKLLDYSRNVVNTVYCGKTQL